MIRLQKIAGATLLALILVVGLNILGDMVEDRIDPTPDDEEEEEVVQPATAPGPAAPGPVAPGPAAPAPALPAPAQNAAAGKDAVKKCTACHTFEQGGPNRTGPNLWGVAGRPVASAPGFAYSDALKGLGGVWTPDRLDAFITNPKQVAPGTKMGFAGEGDPKARAAILSYLTSLK